MNIEHRTSNEKSKDNVEKSSGFSIKEYACFFILAHSKFDVGRWTFDVHLLFRRSMPAFSNHPSAPEPPLLISSGLLSHLP